MPSDKIVRKALCHAIHTSIFTGRHDKFDSDAYIKNYQCRKDSQIIKLYRLGKSYRQISAALGVSTATIHSIIGRGKNT